MASIATRFQTPVQSKVTITLASLIRSLLAITTKDVGDRCRHLIQHFARPHYRLDKEGIANAQLALYLAKNHNTRARLESCETCGEGLLLIIK